MNTDEFFMAKAISLAKEAAARDEVPVGALVVKDGEIVASSSNRVEEDLSVTAHAELLVLQTASRKLQNWRLQGCALYVTLEPCVMCAAAIRMSRVSRIVFGADDIRLGGFKSFINLAESTIFGPKPEIVGGILEAESSLLLKEFFKVKRARSHE